MHLRSQYLPLRKEASLGSEILRAVENHPNKERRIQNYTSYTCILHIVRFTQNLPSLPPIFAPPIKHFTCYLRTQDERR